MSGRERIAQGWEISATPAGQFSHPEQLESLAADKWLHARSLGTAAEILRSLRLWSLDGPTRNFDADDWWYRVSFDAPKANPDDEIWLGFDGLATVADVWLNGHAVLHSTSMHQAHELKVKHLLRAGSNQIAIRFQSLDALLATRRPRPRWRAPMVAHQQLRWIRTTLLGRTPGWSPPAAAVGPTRDIWLERRGGFRCTLSSLRTSASPDGMGIVAVSCAVQTSAGEQIERVELEVEREGQSHRADLRRDAPGRYAGSASVNDAALWWPHTHGDPALYEVRAWVHLRGETTPRRCDFGRTGFRTLRLDTTGGGFSLHVNGVPVFCRGACWTPLDVVTLRASAEATFAAIVQVREAGMNMVRVGGTMVYEDASFFDACDQHGVLVWQDFMFANMDYPEQDEAFMADVRVEAEQQLKVWQGRPSLAVLCGNSEGEQQAAMWGAPRELWSPSLFHETLPAWVNEGLPGVPYWPSSAHGGAFPHQGDIGTTSYYGVGAYLRAPDDARRSALKFATECLAFANVPDERTIDRMPGGQALKVHHPGWKARTPRDLNAGWDFEDVRDHYLARLFRVDPVACRSVDHDRYLALGRAVTGELMAGAFAEWRRPGSGCGGALIWFLRDLWAGAGWGLVDDVGLPKSCFHALSRALQPVAVMFTDEGNNGLVVHVVNEPAQPLQASLEITLYGPGDVQVGRSSQRIELAARDATSLAVVQGLEGFADLTYAYRFGPPSVTLAHAALVAPDGRVLGEAFHFPAGLPTQVHADIGLTATLDPARSELLVTTQGMAQCIHVRLDGHALSDNDFHLAPGSERRLAVRALGAQAPKGAISALNSQRQSAIVIG